MENRLAVTSKEVLENHWDLSGFQVLDPASFVKCSPACSIMMDLWSGIHYKQREDDQEHIDSKKKRELE